jgi:hypothetical protein
MSNYKIAVLIADVEDEVFREIKTRLSEVVWKDFRSSGIDVFYIKGKNLSSFKRRAFNLLERVRYSKFWPLQYVHDYFSMYRYKYRIPRTFVIGDEIHVDVPEGLSHLTIKMLAGLEKLEKLEYDFVYRTTLSTVVNLEVLEKQTKFLGIADAIYAGYLVDFNTHPFISGTSTLVNRKAIKVLSKYRRKLNFAKLDDVAIGRVLENLVEPVPIPHLNITSSEDIENLSPEDLAITLSYRCKTKTIPRTDWQIADLLVSKMRNQERDKSDVE